MWGYFSSSTTLVFSSFILRYWSTECSFPVIARSFFNSTVTCFPTNSLKYEKNSYQTRTGNRWETKPMWWNSNRFNVGRKKITIFASFCREETQVCREKVTTFNVWWCFFLKKKNFIKYFYVWFVGSICWCWTLQTVDLVRHLVVGHTNKILTVKMILGLGRHPSKPVVWPVGYDLGRAKSESESIWLKPRKTAIWVLDCIILGLGWVGSENRQSF